MRRVRIDSWYPCIGEYCNTRHGLVEAEMIPMDTSRCVKCSILSALFLKHETREILTSESCLSILILRHLMILRLHGHLDLFKDFGRYPYETFNVNGRVRGSNTPSGRLSSILKKWDRFKLVCRFHIDFF